MIDVMKRVMLGAIGLLMVAVIVFADLLPAQRRARRAGRSDVRALGYCLHEVQQHLELHLRPAIDHDPHRNASRRSMATGCRGTSSGTKGEA